jgi:oligoribonuclease (3'-5' exoribonuclease)
VEVAGPLCGESIEADFNIVPLYLDNLNRTFFIYMINWSSCVWEASLVARLIHVITLSRYRG